MPVAPGTPDRIRLPLEEMEAIVQSVKQSMVYAAPEMQDAHWASLQHRLAGLIIGIVEEES